MDIENMENMENEEIIKLRLVMGSNLRKIRTTQKITIDELAHVMDLSPSFISLIERGDRGITSFNLRKLSEILNVSANEFFKEPQQGKIIKNKDKENFKLEQIEFYSKKMNKKEIEMAIKFMQGLLDLRQ